MNPGIYEKYSSKNGNEVGKKSRTKLIWSNLRCVGDEYHLPIDLFYVNDTIIIKFNDIVGVLLPLLLLLLLLRLLEDLPLR